MQCVKRIAKDSTTCCAISRACVLQQTATIARCSCRNPQQQQATIAMCKAAVKEAFTTVGL
eukprot:17344-Heterococcus_DN1.PRE.1